mgnify:CR=1 FL=1
MDAPLLKDPDARLDFGADWSEWLQPGEKISLSEWDIPPGIEVARDGLGEEVAGIVGGAVTVVWLQGGSPGRIYPVINRVTTDSQPIGRGAFHAAAGTDLPVRGVRRRFFAPDGSESAQLWQPASGAHDMHPVATVDMPAEQPRRASNRWLLGILLPFFLTTLAAAAGGAGAAGFALGGSVAEQGVRLHALEARQAAAEAQLRREIDQIFNSQRRQEVAAADRLRDIGAKIDSLLFHLMKTAPQRSPHESRP